MTNTQVDDKPFIDFFVGADTDEPAHGSSVIQANGIIEIEGVKLPINNPNIEDLEYIPPSSKYIETDFGILKTLAVAVAMDDYMIVEGPTGSGKTDAIKHLANLTNNPLRELNLNGGVTVDELLGHRIITQEGTGFQYGDLPEAMRKGHWILINEINAATPDALFCLFQLMDSQRRITLIENKGEIIYPHKNFRMFATMNPNSEYAGTKEMNKALVDRFPQKAVVDYPNSDIELKIIKSKPGLTKVNLKIIKRAISFANMTRKAVKENTLSESVSTRALINWARVLAYSKCSSTAFLLTILNKYDKHFRDVVEKAYELYFPEYQDYKEALKNPTLTPKPTEIEN